MLKRLARATCLVAGACDLTTGLLLLAAPVATLRLMRAHDALSEPAWMRFIGAFVLGVGLLHLYGLLREPRGGARLTHLMEATALLRLVVAAFTASAVATGTLSAAWLSVTMTDGTFALAQVALLRKDAFGHEG